MFTTNQIPCVENVGPLFNLSAREREFDPFYSKGGGSNMTTTVKPKKHLFFPDPEGTKVDFLK